MMDWGQTIVTLITVLVGSGLIQFFFTRKDAKKKEAKIDHDEEMKKDMRDHLTSVNNKWKEDYCDKNAKAIADLADEVKTGLEERETKGLQRYEEHKLVIEKMSVQHQKDFIALKDAIQKLTENDSKITASIEKMANKQDVIADSLIGQAHDRIIFLTDKISERGAITIKEKATLASMYEPYKKLGGNGHCATAVAYVNTLKVVSDDEAKAMDIQIKKQRENE